VDVTTPKPRGATGIDMAMAIALKFYGKKQPHFEIKVRFFEILKI
jgi:hypothetical protein